MPQLLLFASIWSGQTGSLLTWILCIAVMMLFVLKDQLYRAKALPIILVFLGLLLIMLIRSQPFELNPLLPIDGLGLNPVLSHPLLIIHPPFAFISYSLIVAIYAYAIVAFREHSFDIIFRKILVFASVSLAALSLTIILGSLWAYEVVGWGGYWSFDPIENGSLIAWLLLTVLIHFLKLFKKGLSSWKPIILSCFFVMFSVIHMVFLIRSGLLSQISSHAYVQGNLLYMLLLTDVLVLILPLAFFLFKTKTLPKLPPHKPSYRCFIMTLCNWTLISIAIVLFIFTQLPLLPQYKESILLVQTSKQLPWIVLLLSLLLLILSLFYYRHAFYIKKTHRPSIEKLLLIFFFAFVSMVILQPSLNIAVFSLRGLFVLMLVFLCYCSLYVFLHRWHRVPWRSKGSPLLHAALPLLILGSLAIALPISPAWLHLSPGQTYYSPEYKSSFTLMDSIDESIYTGEKSSYPIKVSTNNSNYTASPAIWKYNRDKKEQELFIPDIQHRLLLDYHIVPVGKGIFRIKKSETRYINEISVFFKYTEVSNNEQQHTSLTKEEFTLFLSTDSQKEELLLSRWKNKVGTQVRSDPVFSSILNDTVQIISFQKDTLVISLASLKQHIALNFYHKPMALLIRLAYFLILLSSLWIMLEKITKKNPKEANEQI